MSVMRTLGAMMLERRTNSLRVGKVWHASFVGSFCLSGDCLVQGFTSPATTLDSGRKLSVASLNSQVYVPNSRREAVHLSWNSDSCRLFSTATEKDFGKTTSLTNGEDMSTQEEGWTDILPFEEGSHRSARILIPIAATLLQNGNGSEGGEDPFQNFGFKQRLEATVTACRELGKSSIWVEVPMSRASLIEDMVDSGLKFHHAEGEKAVLNLWLRPESESKIPLFATHNVGVGGVVVNSRDEILCVRELRKNYKPWKTPTGLSDLGETIDQAVEREVLEETGIRAKFHSILGFRQTHGLAHGRSDLFFVCRLDPVEEVDEHGTVVIPEPQAQACEIEVAQWVPMSEYKAMINGENGHPMMSHVMAVFDAGKKIEKKVVESVVPGRKPNAMFYPSYSDEDAMN